MVPGREEWEEEIGSLGSTCILCLTYFSQHDNLEVQLCDHESIISTTDFFYHLTSFVSSQAHLFQSLVWIQVKFSGDVRFTIK